MRPQLNTTQTRTFLNPEVLQFFSIDEIQKFRDSQQVAVGESEWIKEVIRREEESIGTDFEDLEFDDIDPDDWHMAS